MPKDKRPGREQIGIVRPVRLLWEDSDTAAIHDGQCPGGQIDSPDVTIGNFVVNADSRALFIEGHGKFLLDTCRFCSRRLHQTDRIFVLDIELDGIVIDRIAPRHGLGCGPQTMAAPWLPAAQLSFLRQVGQFSENILSCKEGITNQARANISGGNQLNGAVREAITIGLAQIGNFFQLLSLSCGLYSPEALKFVSHPESVQVLCWSGVYAVFLRRSVITWLCSISSCSLDSSTRSRLIPKRTLPNKLMY